MAAYKDEARGTWYVSFHYNDWTGKNKRKLKRGFRTRREALEYEQKFLLQQATNLDMMFADFYKLYEEDLKPKLKLNTWRTKDVIFQKKLIPYFKDKKMNEISPADIIKWQNEMIKKRQADGKDNIAHTSVDDLEMCIKSLLNFYDQHGQGHRLVIPLMGTNLSRAGLSHNDSLRVITSLFQLYGDKIHGEVDVVIYKGDKDKVTLDI